ncbi:MAG TPA: hypothetical protein DCF91_01655 [Porphyromonadaceae bacterium]|nr:hypothetical protein [Porphyromonadaceae bacterium]
MKKYLSYPVISVILSIATLLSLYGCVSEIKEYEESDDNKIVSLDVNVISASEQISTIQNYRLVIAEFGSGLIYQNKATQNNTLDQPVDKRLNVSLKPGKYKTYLLANEHPLMSSILNNAKFLSEIDKIIIDQDIIEDFTENNIPMLAENTIEIKADPSSTTDGGLVKEPTTDWGPSYTAKLQRVVAKVSLVLNKNTSYPIQIKQAILRHVPQQSYFGLQNYPTVTFNDFIAFDGQNTGIDLPIKNGDNYVSIFPDKYICEHILSDQLDLEKATYLEIKALFNQIPTTYIIPIGIPVGSTYSDYSITRNTHYLIKGSISEINDFKNQFHVAVLDWDKEHADVDYNNSYTWEINWDNPIVNGVITIRSNEIAICNFRLNSPSGRLWTATLSNGADFEFDYTNNGVSQGIGNSGSNHMSKIRIKARKPLKAGASTKLFVNCEGEILKINNNQSDYFTIKLLPLNN